MAKITIATVKSFIKKNRASLYINQTSDFDGMTDCVQSCDNGFSPAADAQYTSATNNLGIAGVWLVGGSRDYCSAYEKNGFKGFEVYNCCGSFIVAVKS